MTAALVAEVRRRAGGPGGGALHLDRVVAGHRHPTPSTPTDEVVATTVGPPGARGGAAHRRRRRAGRRGRRHRLTGCSCARGATRMRGYWGTADRASGPVRVARPDRRRRPRPACSRPMAGSPRGTSDCRPPRATCSWSEPEPTTRYILRGGYNVPTRPRWKRCWPSHPAVARVAVVGVPDEVLGEIGVAVVVVRQKPPRGAAPDLAELRAHCATGQRLADYKALRRPGGGGRTPAADPHDEGRPQALTWPSSWARGGGRGPAGPAGAEAEWTRSGSGRQ